MKKTLAVVVLGISCSTLWVQCKPQPTSSKAAVVQYDVYGDSIQADKAISMDQLYGQMKKLTPTDTLSVKVEGNITAVCQKKGCWMRMPLSKDGSELFVRFKDYGFFMPMNAAGQKAIIEGKAFVDVQTVEALKHYAKDAGKSQASIDSITAPQTTYSFMAHGVLLQK